MAKREKVQDFLINNSGALGDTQLIAAPGAGFFLRILSASFMVGGTSNVSFKNLTNARAVSGVLPCSTSTGMVNMGGNPDGGGRCFDLDENQAFAVTSSAAVQVGGFGTYQKLKIGSAE